MHNLLRQAAAGPRPYSACEQSSGMNEAEHCRRERRSIEALAFALRHGAVFGLVRTTAQSWPGRQHVVELDSLARA